MRDKSTAVIVYSIGRSATAKHGTFLLKFGKTPKAGFLLRVPAAYGCFIVPPEIDTTFEKQHLLTGLRQGVAEGRTTDPSAHYHRIPYCFLWIHTISCERHTLQ